jgi:hypothetical protein
MEGQGNLLGLVTVDRQFNGALSVGQTFKIDMDTAPSGTETRWALQVTGGFTFPQPQFTLTSGSNLSGPPHYLITDKAGTVDTGIPVTDQGVHFDFTLTGPDTYSLAVTPIATGLTATITGEIALPGQPIAWLDLHTSKASITFDPAKAAYFNNIAIVPEPSAVCFAGFAAAAALYGLPRPRRRAQA